jgi:hypothetical protein
MEDEMNLNQRWLRIVFACGLAGCSQAAEHSSNHDIVGGTGSNFEMVAPKPPTDPAALQKARQAYAEQLARDNEALVATLTLPAAAAKDGADPFRAA